MRKLLFFGDHSDWHSGSAAVADYIRRQAAMADYRVVTADNAHTLDREQIEECDVVLVNGEGTMHNNKKKARFFLEVLREAQQMGKETMLVNTVWYRMDHTYDDVLNKLDRLDVRDTQSQFNLHEHAAFAEVYPDLSYRASDVATLDRIRTSTTDLWLPRPKWHYADFAYTQDITRIDLKAQTWSDTLRQVASSEYLYTGRFHGVMAAVKARTPFRACPGNTPKIEGFLSGFHRDTSSIVVPAMDLYADHDYSVQFFNELFDWVESQPIWHL